MHRPSPILITHGGDDHHPLVRQQWTFRVDGPLLVLVEWTRSTRASKRHKWVEAEAWREPSHASVPPLPDWVRGAAMHELYRQVEVLHWHDWILR